MKCTSHLGSSFSFPSTNDPLPMSTCNSDAQESAQITPKILLLSFGQKGAFLGGSDGKEFTCNAGDPGSIPGSRSPGEEHGYALQYSCLENSIDRGAWRVTVHGVTKIQTQLNN